MKTLAGKIIKKLTEFVKHSPTSEFEKGLQQAVIVIEKCEKDAGFEEIARELMKYLAQNHNPHVTAIITSTNAELLEGLKSTGKVMDYIPD